MPCDDGITNPPLRRGHHRGVFAVPQTPASPAEDETDPAAGRTLGGVRSVPPSADSENTNGSTAAQHKRSGHRWSEFISQLAEHGLQITAQRDITANVLPTLRLAHMVVSPLRHADLQILAQVKLRRKQPGLHYVMEDALGLLEQFATSNIDIIDPYCFAADRQYMLLRIEHVG